MGRNLKKKNDGKKHEHDGTTLLLLLLLCGYSTDPPHAAADEARQSDIKPNPRGRKNKENNPYTQKRPQLL